MFDFLKKYVVANESVKSDQNTYFLSFKKWGNRRGRRVVKNEIP